MKKISLLLSLFLCSSALADSSQSGTVFADDLSFLREHTQVVVLKQGDGAVAVVPEYQGRVMTSSFDAKRGPSLGWINRDLIAEGVLPEAERAGELTQHIHVFGGEERLWLGPEGGQFGIYFEPDAPFEFTNWKVPPALDTEGFTISKRSKAEVSFTREARFQNWSGTRFETRISRTVRLLDRTELNERFRMGLGNKARTVAYETDNRLKNIGTAAWTRDSGTLSLWILGMYPPSADATIVIPYREGGETELGPLVNDAYFGKIAPERLVAREGVVFMKADGRSRGKIGLSPNRSLGRAGSYDPQTRVLTLVLAAQPEGEDLDYVNSMWEMQNDPYAGDVINAYNDGPPEPGAPPLGPFFELETSSPAAALAPGEELRHLQTTIHLTGPPKLLNRLARRFLGADLDTIEATFIDHE